MSGQESKPTGSQAPSSSQQPADSRRPPDPKPTWTFPKLFIFKPRPAWESPQIDERCFIYCSQNSRKRASGEDPLCRSICFRKVYGHEVHDGSYDASRDINGKLRPTVPLPLPPEGQPSDIASHVFVENNEKTRYWKEGRYIWVSKSSWGIQEKLDSMTLSLPRQTAWSRYKQNMERQRLDEEQAQYSGQSHQAESHDENANNTGRVPAPDPSHFFQNSAIAVRGSLLFPVTPLSTVIQETLHQKLDVVLIPTYKVLDIFHRSFTEGTQTRFIKKVYEQATNGSTVALMRNAWSKHESWWKEVEERKETEERKKKGGGNEVGENGRDM